MIKAKRSWSYHDREQELLEAMDAIGMRGQASHSLGRLSSWHARIFSMLRANELANIIHYTPRGGSPAAYHEYLIAELEARQGVLDDV